MRRSPTRRWLLLPAILAALLLLDRAYPPPLGRSEELSALVLAENGELLQGFTTSAGYWRLPLAADEVEPLYLRMLLAYEDRRFHYHPGVDPLALARALGQWLREGRIVSGGSTLTMQVARLLEPQPRTIAGKLRQMLRAVQLEWRLSKREILGLYLTLAPYGGNLEGLRAASLAYFGKEPQHLTPAQSALLVVLPQSPERLRPDREPEAAREARDKVLWRMQVRGVLSAQQVVEAGTEPVPEHRLTLPMRAPHLARRLHAEHPGTAPLRTTLDHRLQTALEALIEHALIGLPERANLAVLVVRHRDRVVRAYLGGAAFFSAARSGQLDLVRAVRSPGSALKPAIYGRAFDQGVAHPETRIVDRPTRFGNYRPSNFLHAYHGEVSLREALQRSLNIPAVALLERLGPIRVDRWLDQAGLPPVWPDDQVPGLPLVLGGVGMSLEQLVTLYAAIASDGLSRPLRLLTDSKPAAPRPFLSTETARQLRAILLGSAPPEGLTAGRGIAFKTGTAYGYRDAWALGFDREHTVGVWVGRPDGTPMPGRHGRNTAAPLLFAVFDLLPPAPLSTATLAERGEPPPALRRFERPNLATHGPPLQLSFPVDGSTVELQAGQTRLPLVAEGGEPPLHWLINGRPLDAPGRSQQGEWPVDGPGSVRVTVLDAAGRSASAEVWVRLLP